MITVDDTNNKLTISSNNTDYIGYNKIIITYTFNHYMTENELTTDFSLLILPSPNTKPNEFAKKPYFDFDTFEPVYNLMIGEGWSIDLPLTLHPDDTKQDKILVLYETVDVSSARFIKYDQDELTLTLEEGATEEKDAG